MQKLLFTIGLALFLIGLLTGLVIPALKNPRMALSSHLEGVLNGMFLVVLGLLWPHIDLPEAWQVIAVALIVYSAYANWLATLLAAAWGAGRKFAPIATGDHKAPAANGGKDRHQLTYEQFARMLTLMGPSDLWTVERAARHWGVSASRARAILSSRHIHRVSGYPAQAIKAVTLRQGARTDLKTANHLVPAAQAFTMAETGAAIGETEDERARLRIFFEFLRGADETGTSALDLIVDEPALIGEHRFDALLAAAAEYISARWGRPGPLWSVSIERFLDTAWWVSDLPSARAFAAVWTPAPFRRRGIYLDRHDLTSDGVCVMPEPVFNRTELQRAFTALAAKLERRGVVGQVHVVGGAAMLLAYNSRVTTRDIDALFSTDGPMLEAIREVADEMGWPRTWLNNQASGYVSRTPGEGAPVFDHPFLHVVATPAQHLLAMKVVAARGVRDGEDIRLLLDRLRITSAAGVWEIVARYFPAETITDRSRLLVEDLLNQ